MLHAAQPQRLLIGRLVKNPKQSEHRHPALLPFDMADLVFASWETITRRSWMMLAGECSPAEYQHMLSEKMEAVCDSAMAAAFTPGPSMMSAALEPWTRRARANALRLRGAV